ncbi:hypothetical protein ACPEEL_03695 [Pasteurella sp. PK-2025]|uniref:hypothetical protein n=1 Tax=unclassified Pasteurella TaxID=2621516 RepID=UPI003C763AF0
MKIKEIYSKEYLLLWNLMMSLESNVVTNEEVDLMSSFDMNNKEDVIKLFNLYVKDYFLSLNKEKQDEILCAINKILLAERNIADYFFECEFGSAAKEPDDKQEFLKLVKEILNLYLRT